MKDKIKLVDSTFSHSKLGYCSDFQSSSVFEWDRDNINPLGDEYIVYTDSRLSEANNSKNSIAWLIEPIDILTHSYNYIKDNNHKFFKVFTHEKTLLDRGENYELLPFGCSWIKPEDQKIYEKSKIVSIISSNKKLTEGHLLRYEIINKYINKMSVFGRGYNPIDYKLEGLKDYRFSVVVENCKRDYWFTEKLIDCLLTGTVPIYWGCPSIGDFFDINGFIVINNINDLDKIIDNLSEEMYRSKLNHILYNYSKAKHYVLPDNLIYNKIKNE